MPNPYNLTTRNCSTCPEMGPRRFCRMAAKAIAAVSKFTTFYPKASLLYVEGEAPRGVYVLCSGRVKLTTSSAEGRNLILRTAEAGELLGASAVISHRDYETSVETLEPCQVNFIRAEDFLNMITNDREAMLSAAVQLSADYFEAQRELRTFGLARNTGEKLARLVLDWCATGEKTSRGVRLKVLMTHEEIAQMIGTTRETVTRLLSDLKKNRLIEVKGSTFLVPSTENLQALVTV